MKKLLIPLLCFAFLTTPFAVQAQYTGLVKCDGVILASDSNVQNRKKCSFVELVKQIQFLISWGIGLLIAITVLVAVYVGGLYMYAGFTGDVGKAQQARGYFYNIFGGILIVLFAWLIVRTLLNYLVDTNEFGLDLLGK